MRLALSSYPARILMYGKVHCGAGRIRFRAMHQKSLRPLYRRGRSNGNGLLGSRKVFMVSLGIHTVYAGPPILSGKYEDADLVARKVRGAEAYPFVRRSVADRRATPVLSRFRFILFMKGVAPTAPPVEGGDASPQRLLRLRRRRSPPT